MSGTEKLRPLLIGKSKKPRYFKQVKSLPLDYYGNKKSWMTSEIFNLWLMKLDKKMVSEKRKILLFIDNCTAHNLTSTFNAIKVQFLPPNTTSVLQPLDQGMINNFKIFYRKEIVKKIVSAINDTNQIVINILDAIRLCDKAWRHVKKETIVNRFTKSGFRTSTENIPDEPSDDNNDEWDQLNLNETLTSYVNVDENLEICGEWTENDIISDILDEDNEEEIEDHQIQSTITNKEAKFALETLRKYIEGNEGMEDLFKPLDDKDEFETVAKETLDIMIEILEDETNNTGNELIDNVELNNLVEELNRIDEEIFNEKVGYKSISSDVLNKS
ncbi:hypothetical protein QTP88_012011 [Uroleucon formosanum]